MIEETQQKHEVLFGLRIVSIFGSYNFDHVDKILRTVSSCLMEKNYFPVLLDIRRNICGESQRFAEFLNYLYELGWTARQVTHLLLGISRFAIIDDSVPSGAIIEIGYARNTGTITFILVASDDSHTYRSSWMMLDFPIHSKDFILKRYRIIMRGNSINIDINQVKELVEEIISDAEKRLAERLNSFNKFRQEYRNGLNLYY